MLVVYLFIPTFQLVIPWFCVDRPDLCLQISYTLQQTNIAIGNGPFIDYWHVKTLTFHGSVKVPGGSWHNWCFHPSRMHFPSTWTHCDEGYLDALDQSSTLLEFNYEPGYFICHIYIILLNINITIFNYIYLCGIVRYIISCDVILTHLLRGIVSNWN
jgi:hypothetical protein